MINKETRRNIEIGPKIKEIAENFKDWQLRICLLLALAAPFTAIYDLKDNFDKHEYQVSQKILGNVNTDIDESKKNSTFSWIEIIEMVEAFAILNLTRRL